MARCARSDCRRWRPNLLVARAWTGFRLDDAWYCSSACVELAAQRRLRHTRRAATAGPAPLPPLKLGLLLLHQGAVTADDLQKGLDQQKRTGLRLGAQLRSLGCVQPFDVLRALAAQDGVKYVTALDLTRLSDAPGGLSRDAVRALGLVPFGADDQRKILNVACTAPVSRLALGAIRELTGWTVDPYMVIDELMPTLVDAYGTARATATLPPALRDVTDAAARVAQLAKDTRSVWIAQARCDPYLWVRLQGPSSVEDLLLPVDSAHEEQACRAQPTSR